MKSRTRVGYQDAQRPRVEVIPMIDIMMFLLVFFVVISLQMIAGTGVDMELPGSKTTRNLLFYFSHPQITFSPIICE